MTWLQQRLNELGLTHDDLRERLAQRGIDRVRATITGWTNGKAIKLLSDPEQASILAEALKWTLTELLLAAGYEIEADIEIRPELYSLIRQYNDLSYYRRILFMQTLRRFTEFADSLTEDELHQAIADGK